MTLPEVIDWDPTSPQIQHNDKTAYDEVRGRCPVAHAANGSWTVLAHPEALEVLHQDGVYSSAVSRYPSVPNGMDLPEHTSFRRVVDEFYHPARMRAFEHVCRRIVRNLLHQIVPGQQLDLMDTFARPFANEVQCAFMGWPSSLHTPLQEWVHKNQVATRAQDRDAMSAVALEFDGVIRDQLAARRSGEIPFHDVTWELMQARVNDRGLTDDEIVSIIRNWTVGELGTIAASVGIMANFLAERPHEADNLRELLKQGRDLASATDEILRITSPFISSRRKTTEAAYLGSRSIPAGSRVNVNWASANRDETVFGDPDVFDLSRDPSANLLYGAGIHVCPGKPLAQLELRIVLEELLTTFSQFTVTTTPTPAQFPASGFTVLEMILS
ncbi:cytochrome P450 [Jonesiaceae bacterium BS-20]|uniref:Cytochrome P450 n=1 Tax=Jonesiaceae bacterium BS-20 TaxID=3120821 RepID=A0AAU7DVM6_9MICO